MLRAVDNKVSLAQIAALLRRYLVTSLVYGIRLYRYLLKPWFGYCCRFHPTCSHYAEQALQQKGVTLGCLLTIWRLLRCHPFHPGGIDPVPGTPSPQDIQSTQKEESS